MTFSTFIAVAALMFGLLALEGVHMDRNAEA
ncbi:hypothetical protein Premu_0525 [Hallella multisaccharivorax DSM 17128]|uniref:Uncharacterized protein n=1 Tax=Hallella multisaccharivorax DSM 17128 TaxID=688246 RepID=F8NCB4_9BACT|nr:hypothetical protein Premu_0525 [Hallella multisaccharivorax DSM 17128]